MFLDFTMEEMWYLRNKMKKGKVCCHSRATEIGGRILRVLGLENSLGEFRKGMCVFNEWGMNNLRVGKN